MVFALHDLVMASSTFDLVVIPFLIVVIVALVALIFVFARKNSFSMWGRQSASPVGSLQDATQETEMLRSQLVEVKEQFVQAGGQLEDARTELEEAQSQLESIRRERDEIRGQLGEVSQQLERTDNELAVAQRRLAETTNRLDTTQSELAKAQKYLEEINDRQMLNTGDTDQPSDALGHQLDVTRERLAEAKQQLEKILGGDLLMNKPWLKLATECIDLLDELDKRSASFDRSRQELAIYVCSQLELKLERAGADVIADDAVFDEKRHLPEPAESRVAPGTAIAETLSPGFVVGPRVLRRARVRLV